MTMTWKRRSYDNQSNLLLNKNNFNIEKMVRVTLHYLTRKGSQNAPKHGKDSKEHAKRLTHLYLNDQYIDFIVGLYA